MKKLIIIISVIVLISIIYFSMMKEENSVKNPDFDKVLRVIESEIYKDLNRVEDREQYINRIIQMKGTVEEVDTLNKQLIFEAVEGRIIVILQKDQDINGIMEEDQIVVRGIGIIDEEDIKTLRLVTSIIVNN
ncbi:hypothetical protein GOQ27_09265 [Clostridium sp. D2Q-11]|uniref:tRNA_anti-like n=1 Tax=Anaeromonas frigoriresistens TaxID=2683708 RepID=A0A942UT49_9FIRM|nr:hypothetical protein [Anaeromonas frigoriresistens]MBS4538653.1 hypothetical protein [Anaeromonas frigoriresistens]